MVMASDTGEHRVVVAHCPDHSGLVVALKNIQDDIQEMKSDVKVLKSFMHRTIGGLSVLIVVAQIVQYFVR